MVLHQYSELSWHLRVTEGVFADILFNSKTGKYTVTVMRKFVGTYGTKAEAENQAVQEVKVAILEAVAEFNKNCEDFGTSEISTASTSGYLDESFLRDNPDALK